jgi:hypothetical protein
LRTEAQLKAIEAKRNQPAQPMDDPVDEEDQVDRFSAGADSNGTISEDSDKETIND